MKARLLCLTFAVAVGLGCDDVSPLTVSSGSGDNQTLNVSGTWIGDATDSTRAMRMTVQLTQSNQNVTGTLVATRPFGAPIYTSGAIAGTVSATTFTFTFGVPRGAVADAPDCTASFTGTADDVQATSMAGTYTGTDTCGGTFAGGRFTLLNQ